MKLPYWVTVVLSCWLILLVIIKFLLLSIPGDYIPFYAILACIAATAALSDHRLARRLAIAAIILTMALIVEDFYAGKAFTERMRRKPDLRNATSLSDLSYNAIRAFESGTGASPVGAWHAKDFESYSDRNQQERCDFSA
jgi:hypothetical protein